MGSPEGGRQKDRIPREKSHRLEELGGRETGAYVDMLKEELDEKPLSRVCGLHVKAVLDGVAAENVFRGRVSVLMNSLARQFSAQVDDELRIGIDNLRIDHWRPNNFIMLLDVESRCADGFFEFLRKKGFFVNPHFSRGGERAVCLDFSKMDGVESDAVSVDTALRDIASGIDGEIDSVVGGRRGRKSGKRMEE